MPWKRLKLAFSSTGSVNVTRCGNSVRLCSSSPSLPNHNCALVAEEFAGRFLAHREKARLRDRRYRGLKALPAPERAAELAASAENATPATPQAQWLTTQIRQAVSEIGQHGGKLDTVVAAQR